ncbi:MAG: hypothetical protein ISS55_11015 [Dehalococcoidales bacterium]|nr:hypothetical protein [Dehalococcoidales bacterium]
MSNPYRMLGLVLCVAGGTFAPIAYFAIGSVPFTALGLSAIMLGFTCIALANARPPVSPEACELMLRTGMQNTAALLEELELRGKAVYLPSAMTDGSPKALIPLTDGQDILHIREKIPARLIVRYGREPGDMAISVTTAGSMHTDLLETKPGPTSGEIEAALTYILTGVLDIATSVAVRLTDSTVDVEVGGSRMHYEDVWYYRCLGSPIASIVAAISSEALERPVRIKDEDYSKGKSRIVLEVLSS